MSFKESVSNWGLICFFDYSGQIKSLLDHQEELYERQSELKALLEHFESSRSCGEDETSVSMRKWSGTFEWDSRADDIRFNVFGISSYRVNQREVSTFLPIFVNFTF